MRLVLAAVTRQGNAAPQGDHQPFLVQRQGGEIDGIDENIPGIPQVGNRGGEKARGGENGVIIPAFDAEALQGAFPGRIKRRLFQVAVQQRLARPAHLRQLAAGIQ